MRFIAFLGGLLFGAAFGGVTGLLLAPESGTDLQTRLRSGYNEVLEEGKRAAAQRKVELEAQFAEAKRVSR